MCVKANAGYGSVVGREAYGVSMLLFYLAFQSSVPVDVMPGQYDPTNYTLPQQPLHRCMLPLSSVYPTLQLASNPYKANIDGLR